MKIRIIAELAGPIKENTRWTGNEKISSVFTGEFEIEITPETFEKLLEGFVFVGGMTCHLIGSYSRELNALSAVGRMKGKTPEDINALMKNGWKPLQEGLDFYGIKLPE